MLGAIAGDISGAPYEAAPIKTTDFDLFGPGVRYTDDSVCTVAVADALMQDADVAERLRAWGAAHPDAGYGGMFRQWLADPGRGAYGSYGNGAAMRVSPVTWVAEDEDQCLRLAEITAAVSHDHPEAIAGAQARPSPLKR
mgnify:CR=1 FL=1